MEDRKTIPLELSAENKARLINLAKNQKLNMRWSKKYIKDELKLDIGDRGGVVILQEEKGCSLWEVVKTSETEYGRAPNKAKLLGRPGAMGKVKIIRNIETGEEKALKVLAKDYKKDPRALAHFEREAKILGILRRGRKDIIWKQYAKDEEAKTAKPSIVMDIFPGRDLFDVLHEGQLTSFERIDIFLQILQEVRKIHKAGIIHCDLKPENIKYDPITKKVSIIDFGYAHEINDTNAFGGTLEYQWPKRTGEAVPELDIFSLSRIARDLFGFSLRVGPDKYVGNVDPNAEKNFEIDPPEKRQLLDLIFDMTGGYDFSSPISIDEAIIRTANLRQQWLENHVKHSESSMQIITSRLQIPVVGEIKLKGQKDKKATQEVKESKEAKLLYLMSAYLAFYKESRKESAFFDEQVTTIRQIIDVCGDEIKAIQKNLPRGIEKNTTNAVLAYIPNVLPHAIQSTAAELKYLLEKLNTVEEKDKDSVMKSCVETFDLLAKLDAASKEKNVGLAILPGKLMAIPSAEKLKSLFAKPKPIIENISGYLKVWEEKARQVKLRGGMV